MKSSAFWLGNFVFDFLSYFLLSAIIIALCFAFGFSSFVGTQDSITALVYLFLLFGMSNLLFTYLICYVFKEALAGQVGVFFLNLIIGSILPIILVILRMILASPQANGLVWFLRLFPPFSFGEGVINLGGMSILSLFSGTTLQVFDADITLGPIIYLASTFGLYLIGLLIYEIIVLNKNKLNACFFGNFDEPSRVIKKKIESDVFA